MNFYDSFIHYFFQFLEDEFDWKFMNEIFQYLVHTCANPHEIEYFKPLPTFLGVRTSKSETDKFVVPSDPPSPSHQTALALEAEVGEIENPPIDLSPSPPTQHAQDFCANLAGKPDGFHTVSFS